MTPASLLAKVSLLDSIWWRACCAAPQVLQAGPQFPGRSLPAVHAERYILLHMFLQLLHRCYKLDPGFLEARGTPVPLAPAQRMMLAAQVRSHRSALQAHCMLRTAPVPLLACMLPQLPNLCSAPSSTSSSSSSSRCSDVRAHLRHANLAPWNLLPPQNPSWCYTCNIYKPIRTKHCSNCDRCASAGISLIDWMTI